jgi:imidazoleglycerol phosphate synthase glutamine amidotransferase subunit HisH
MIHVVDYGSGNIGTVLNMIKRVSGEALRTGDARVLSAATKILLLGVGSFDNAMQKLQCLGLVEVLHGRAATSDADDLPKAQKIILPGVGSLDNAMCELDQLVLIQPLRDFAAAGVLLFGNL